MPPWKTSLEPGTDVSRAATSPPVHDSAVPSVSPRARQRSSTSSCTVRSSRPNRYSRERLRERRLERIGARLRPGLDDEIDVDLEVTGADRRLDAVPVAARVGERLRDRGLADAVEPQDAPFRPRGAVEHLLERRRGDRARPEALELPGRPGQDDDDAAARVENDAGRGARDAERHGSPRQRRLLAHARREIGVRAPHPLCEPARDLLDLGLERGIDLELAARDARDELDRPVVVRRPEPTRDEADVGLEAFSQGSFQIGGVVADDRNPDRLEPEPERLLGIERDR